MTQVDEIDKYNLYLGSMITNKFLTVDAGKIEGFTNIKK